MAKSPVEFLRDYVTNGVPSSGAYNPPKRDLREYLLWLEGQTGGGGGGGGADYSDDIAALDSRMTTVEQEVAERMTTVEQEVAERTASASHRPGDAPTLFSGDVAGSADQQAAQALGTVVVTASGATLSLPGGAQLWTRQDTDVEQGVLATAEWRIVRLVNSSDPLSDAVDLGITWLDKNKNRLGADHQVRRVAIQTFDGVVSHRISVSKGHEDADLVAPDGAVYARPYVRTYGDPSSRTGVITLALSRGGGTPGPAGSDGAPPSYEISDDGYMIRWSQPDGSVGPWLDIGSAAAEARAEADRAEVARSGAESARDQAAGFVNDIVSEKEVPITATRNGMEAIAFPAGMNSLETRGYAAMGDGGGAQYVRVASEPSHGLKVRSADRYLPNGSVDAVNGGWWEVDELSLDFRQGGVRTDNTAAQNRVAIQQCLDWARARYLATGSRITLVLSDGEYLWGNGAYDATADWRHIAYVYDGTFITGSGCLVSNTPFATRSVGFVCRGNNIKIAGPSFRDTNVSGSPFFIPIGAGTAYDSGLESGRTYRNLEVDDCRMDRTWLSASVQFAASDDGTIKWDGVRFTNSKSHTEPTATSGGNFNTRSDPPGKVLNVHMSDNVSMDGKTASSYNLVGVWGGSIVNNESYRNLYAGCEIENGCQDIIVSVLRSYDEAKALWIDDSRRITWGGIAMLTTTEMLATPLLGTMYRSRCAVHITYQGFTGHPDYVTTDIVGGGIVGEFNRIEIAAFGTQLGSAKVGTVVIDGYVFEGDGSQRTAGNTGIFVNNVADFTLANARIFGAAVNAITIGVPAGGVARLHNVTTKKVGAETSLGLNTVGSGRLVMIDSDIHAQTLSHTGGTEQRLTRLNGNRMPDRASYAEIVIADDAVGIVALPAGFNSGNIFVEKVSSQTAWGRARIVWSGSFAAAAVGGTNGSTFSVNTSQGTLSGTTGTDGNLTIRANTDLNLYIENRTGSSGTFRVIWES